MKKPFVRFTLFLMMICTACSIPSAASSSQPTSISPLIQLLVKAGANATKTATPFQPRGATQTAIAAKTAPAKPTFGSTVTSTPDQNSLFIEGCDDPNNPPIPLTQPMPDGVVNILVLGSDYRPNAGFRTDIIVLVSVNKKQGTISAVSFPRDLYVCIPGWMTQRINTAQQHGGFNMMQDTMDHNFGVRPQYYMMTNFQGLVSIIDSLGGLDVNVGKYLSDACDRNVTGYSGGWCTVQSGETHMNGTTALWYIRARHTTSDFERGRKAEEVMIALFSRLMSVDAVTKFPQLYQNYSSTVETNMNLGDMTSLLPLAPQIVTDTSRIHQYSITGQETTGYVTPEGGDVQLPNYQAIKDILTEAIFGK